MKKEILFTSNFGGDKNMKKTMYDSWNCCDVSKDMV